MNRKYLAFFKKLVAFLDHLINIDLDRNEMLTLINMLHLYIDIFKHKNF